jgi:hypothetical protein
MMMPLVSLKRSQWYESNNTRKIHKQWLELATRAVQRQVSPDTFRWLMWFTSFTVCDFFWWHWICLVEIFSKVPVVLLSELDVPLELFYSLLFLHKLQEKRGEMREKKQTKRTKITLKAHRSSNEDITSTFRKISTIWIQQHQRKS